MRIFSLSNGIRTSFLGSAYPLSLSLPVGFMCFGFLADEDITPMHMIMIGASYGKRSPSSKEGVSRLIQFESLRWRPKTTQVRVHLGVQEQRAPKMMLRSHTEFVLDVVYMDGKIIL
jgi:hypothetical protein